MINQNKPEFLCMNIKPLMLSLTANGLVESRLAPITLNLNQLHLLGAICNSIVMIRSRYSHSSLLCQLYGNIGPR